MASQAIDIHHDAATQAPAIQTETAAIIQVIERAAMNPNVDIDKMERLLEMQERIMARTAKAAFSAALSRMQPDLPVINERGGIKDRSGNIQSTYALWEDINDAIKPVLAQHEFALSFKVGREDGMIVVTGVLSHSEGHSEETSIHLPTDTSGSKNAVQAVGSSTSYGKRYTACALLNITSRGEDDDAECAAEKPHREPHSPPAKSSASLKRADANGEDAWERMIKELRADVVDVKSTVALRALWDAYKLKAQKDRWPRAWMDSLANEFETYWEGLAAQEAK